MLNESKGNGVALGLAEGARSATGGEPSAAVEVKRWSAGRKKEVVLRLLRGEPVDAVSREVSVPIYKLCECLRRGSCAPSTHHLGGRAVAGEVCEDTPHHPSPCTQSKCINWTKWAPIWKR